MPIEKERPTIKDILLVDVPLSSKKNIQPYLLVHLDSTGNIYLRAEGREIGECLIAADSCVQERNEFIKLVSVILRKNALKPLSPDSNLSNQSEGCSSMPQILRVLYSNDSICYATISIRAGEAVSMQFYSLLQQLFDENTLIQKEHYADQPWKELLDAFCAYRKGLLPELKHVKFTPPIIEGKDLE